MQVKICTKCEIEKPINDFHRNEKGCLGRYSICKICKNNTGKTYHKTHKDERSALIVGYGTQPQ